MIDKKNSYFFRSSAIPVTAEIVPMPVVTSGHSHVHHHRVLPPQHHSHQQIDQHEQLPIEVGANDHPAGVPPNMSSSISSGAITSSSFMPTSMSSSIAATLPRNLENGYAGTQQARKFKKVQALKKLVKTNKSKKNFYVKLHFWQF